MPQRPHSLIFGSCRYCGLPVRTGNVCGACGGLEVHARSLLATGELAGAVERRRERDLVGSGRCPVCGAAVTPEQNHTVLETAKGSIVRLHRRCYAVYRGQGG